MLKKIEYELNPLPGTIEINEGTVPIITIYCHLFSLKKIILQSSKLRAAGYRNSGETKCFP